MIVVHAALPIKETLRRRLISASLMGFSFRLTRDAQKDLTAIRRYTVETWGTEQSRRYLQGMRETIELLAEFPGQVSMAINSRVWCERMWGRGC
ncbi:MAG: type II toxin-antitoxin system RelE/ParE family toxin [Halopseudomonas yangmingensis]